MTIPVRKRRCVGSPHRVVVGGGQPYSAYTGTTSTASIRYKKVKCPTCDGDGYVMGMLGVMYVKCRACQGEKVILVPEHYTGG